MDSFVVADWAPGLQSAAGRELNTALGPPRGPRRELICPAINPISLERVWSFPEHADLSREDFFVQY